MNNWTDKLRIILERWASHVVALIILIVVIRYILKNQVKELRTDGSQPARDGNGSLYYVGRGSEHESVEILLQRIGWSAYLTRRTSNWERPFLVTVFIVLILTLVQSFQDGQWKMPSVPSLITTGVIVFFVIFMAGSFFFTHGDIYSDFNVRNNTKLIAEKLELDVNFEEPPPIPINGPPDRTLVMF